MRKLILFGYLRVSGAEAVHGWHVQFSGFGRSTSCSIQLCAMLTTVERAKNSPTNLQFIYSGIPHSRFRKLGSGISVNDVTPPLVTQKMHYMRV